MSDSAFQLYVAIFKVTRASDGSVTSVQPTPSVDVRAQNAHPDADPKPVNVKIPRTYITTAERKIRNRYRFAKRSGKPEQFYTYFYYSPQLGARVIEDVHERE